MSWFGWFAEKKAETVAQKKEAHTFDDQDRALSAQIRRDKYRVQQEEHQLAMQERLLDLELRKRDLEIKRMELLEDDDEEDDDEEDNEDGQLMKLLGTVLTKMQPTAQASQQGFATTAPATEEEIRKFKEQIPAPNMAIIRTMGDDQILEQLKSYSPSFYSRCSPELLQRIPAIVKE